MEFATDSSLVLRLVWWAGVVLLALVLLLTLYLVALRALFTPRRRRDAYTVLTLWNFLHESLRAEAKERLNEVARRAEMHTAAERLLREGQWGERLLAVITLGQLRERHVWGDLLNLAAEENQILSLAALLLEESAFRTYPKPSHLLTLFGVVLLENVGYRQLNAYWRLRAMIQWLSGKQAKWGEMTCTASWRSAASSPQPTPEVGASPAGVAARKKEARPAQG